MPEQFCNEPNENKWPVPCGVDQPAEKLSAQQIHKRYGSIDSLDTAWHRDDQPEAMRKGRVRGRCIVTDDTFMTLALMRVYVDVARHIDAWDMADGMVARSPGGPAGYRNCNATAR